MGFLWALGGIAAGTLVAVLTGAILDYMQVRNVLPETVRAWMFLPYTMGVGGLLGSLVAVSMYARYLRSRSEKQAARSTRVPTAPERTAPRGMEHVPGMPTFDVEGVRRGEHRAESSTTTVTPPRTPEQPS
jgi:hypothetical protein